MILKCHHTRDGGYPEPGFPPSQTGTISTLYSVSISLLYLYLYLYLYTLSLSLYSISISSLSTLYASYVVEVTSPPRPVQFV